MKRNYPWASLPEDKLLKRQLRALHLTIEGTWLEDCLNDLYEELEERNLRIRPHVWLSDEWFSPDTTPGIAIASALRPSRR